MNGRRRTGNRLGCASDFPGKIEAAGIVGDQASFTAWPRNVSSTAC
jgi:hypothetical protein